MHTIETDEIIKGLVLEHFHNYRSGNLQTFEIWDKSEDEVKTEITAIVFEVTDCPSREDMELLMGRLFGIEKAHDKVIVEVY